MTSPSLSPEPTELAKQFRASWPTPAAVENHARQWDAFAEQLSDLGLREEAVATAAWLRSLNSPGIDSLGNERPPLSDLVRSLAEERIVAAAGDLGVLREWPDSSGDPDSPDGTEFSATAPAPDPKQLWMDFSTIVAQLKQSTQAIEGLAPQPNEVSATWRLTDYAGNEVDDNRTIELLGHAGFLYRRNHDPGVVAQIQPNESDTQFSVFDASAEIAQKALDEAYGPDRYTIYKDTSLSPGSRLAELTPLMAQETGRFTHRWGPLDQANGLQQVIDNVTAERSQLESAAPDISMLDAWAHTLMDMVRTQETPRKPIQLQQMLDASNAAELLASLASYSTYKIAVPPTSSTALSPGGRPADEQATADGLVTYLKTSATQLRAISSTVDGRDPHAYAKKIEQTATQLETLLKLHPELKHLSPASSAAATSKQYRQNEKRNDLLGQPPSVREVVLRAEERYIDPLLNDHLLTALKTAAAATNDSAEKREYRQMIDILHAMALATPPVVRIANGSADTLPDKMPTVRFQARGWPKDLESLRESAPVITSPEQAREQLRPVADHVSPFSSSSILVDDLARHVGTYRNLAQELAEPLQVENNSNPLTSSGVHVRVPQVDRQNSVLWNPTRAEQQTAGALQESATSIYTKAQLFLREHQRRINKARRHAPRSRNAHPEAAALASFADELQRWVNTVQTLEPALPQNPSAKSGFLPRSASQLEAARTDLERTVDAFVKEVDAAPASRRDRDTSGPGMSPQLLDAAYTGALHILNRTQPALVR